MSTFATGGSRIQASSLDTASSAHRRAGHSSAGAKATPPNSSRYPPTTSSASTDPSRVASMASRELRSLYESIRGQVSVARFDLVDPCVQAVDNMAVLTFNYVAEGTNEATSRWNCAEVYRRDAGTWRIIQTRWPYTLAQAGHAA